MNNQFAGQRSLASLVPPEPKTWKRARERIVIITDSQEKKPFKFQEWKVKRKRLITGDYSIEGLEDKVVVERKNPMDFIQSITHERVNFEEELKRMNPMSHKVVVIETDLETLMLCQHYSGVNPSSLLSTIAKICGYYQVPFLVAGDRHLAKAFTLSFLVMAFDNLILEVEKQEKKDRREIKKRKAIIKKVEVS